MLSIVRCTLSLLNLNGCVCVYSGEEQRITYYLLFLLSSLDSEALSFFFLLSFYLHFLCLNFLGTDWVSAFYYVKSLR